MSQPKLFTPFKVGDATLQHRVVMAPLTRVRATKTHVPTPLMAEYYAQRASTPGTLLVSEATFIAAQAGGLRHVPGIWSDEQVAGWKRVTDAVHAQGSYIYVQLWALGRAAVPDVLQEEGSYPYVSASDVQLSGKPVPPRPLTKEEIKEYIALYSVAARNAVRAGFDGVEVHGANGYLIDQFLQDVTNTRTDEYGGSVENRARFALDVLDATVAAVGASKVGIRLSPWSTFNDMRMADLKPSFSYLVSETAERWPSLAYIHLIEPRVDGSNDREVQEGESNDFLREIWGERPFISTGGYNRELALKVAETKGGLIGIGRLFISNPDLPMRWQKDISADKGDRSTYHAMESPEGYIDYPFADDSVAPERFKELSNWA
ncbi:uncharacterized protein PHACADRAFT_124526 [Phanerochaete carnosa HHB-10118-sp]|uniref:NADH:flavin oxidoreductase/NADH oxidase N-terminal domain-containing protein n=1 Tax=Phanerochaete carnosa (strain HHB-10118-sp) TaxID=650164 RepID=K5VNM2_PHACS|nr:uncharacterized protein PHACADRAFT_124526 [Phanerochaete carnosa HHB-10118-sp]EKM53073.1 hypothetical protein PHACADRAFT_124526 [Phanerochaete carnosa HHB-10118-sp]